MFSAERIKGGLEVLANGAIVVVAVLLLWTQVIMPDPAVGDPVEVLDDLTMSVSMLTKRVGTAERVLVEFSDFQCPYCAEYALYEFPRIKRELVDTGIVSYGFLHFPLNGIHPEAAVAGAAAECGGRQGRFWEMHDRLFGSQDQLSYGEFLNHSHAIGLDEMAFEECLLGEDATAAVEADLQQGLALGVRATPTFFLGKVGADGVVELTRRIGGQVTLEGIEDLLAEEGGGLASWLPWW